MSTSTSSRTPWLVQLVRALHDLAADPLVVGWRFCAVLGLLVLMVAALSLRWW